jgi:phospholipid/cholesterol/gamma-HCH transport system substrate-binding protein
MAKRTVTNELKVGVLVVACIIVLVGFLYKTGSFEFKKEGYEIKVLFNIVSGVQKNAPVRLAGVEIGQVKNIELSYADGTKVAVTLWLQERAKLKRDSRAHITALGLMGEKYIEVSPGSKDSPYLKPGETINGEDPLELAALAKKGESIAEVLEETLDNIKALAQNSNLVVTDNKDKIDAIFENLEATTQNFKEFSEDVKKHPWKLMGKGK